MGAFLLTAVAIAFSFSRASLYVFEKNPDLSLPFWICSALILSFALIICLLAVMRMNEEKQKLVDRLMDIKRWCAQKEKEKKEQNKQGNAYEWPVQNAHS